MSHPSFAETVAEAGRAPHTDGMEQRDGWDERQGWYGEAPAEFPVTAADRAAWADEPLVDVEAAEGEPPNPYRTLPPRVALEDRVGVVDTSAPPFDPSGDPNREVANRWGAGIAGF
jgi:hypothetical protein